MNDTPGWASPGSTPSGEQGPGASEPVGPADRTHPAPPTPRSPGWSKEQPPGRGSASTDRQGAPPGPGQESPPPGWGTAPPARPGHHGHGGHGDEHPGPDGHGPHGPRGGGWGGPPTTTVKPGVVPLRPLGVGEILDGAVSTLRTHWRTVLGVTLAVAVLTEIATVLVRRFLLDNSSSAAVNDPDATLDELTAASGESLFNNSMIFVLTLIGIVTATALLATVTSRAVLGTPVTAVEAWHDFRPRIPRLAGLLLLLLLITVLVVTVGAAPGLVMASETGGEGAMALTVLGILGAGIVILWLMVRYSLAVPALMLEKQGVLKALRRSTKLVRGSWWRVLGIQTLALIIANLVALIIVIPFTLIAAAFAGDSLTGFVDSPGGNTSWTFLIITGIGAVVISAVIIYPITAGVTVLLYIDQRIRREALDLELGRAAGVRGYGPGTAPGS